MALVMHVHGPRRTPLPPFGGHLVRNLEWDRFSSDAFDSGSRLVVSPDSPAAGALLLEGLRLAGLDTEVGVLTDQDQDWEPLARLAGVVAAPDRTRLAALLGLGSGTDMLDARDTDGRAVTVDEDVQPRRQVPRGGTRGLLRERLGEGTPGLQSSLQAFEHELFSRSSVTAEQTRTEPRTAGPAADVPSEAPTVPSTGPERQRVGRTARGRRTRPGGGDLGDPRVLVPALLAVTDRLYGVRESGTAVVGHVQETVGVDAVALLVPDGRVWAVAAAVGHRHLEERLVLAADHWLVAELTSGHHGLVVDDTDVVRARLAGSPLAAWPHLMACPVGPSGAIVLMARGESGPSFTSRDLGRAARALDEADDLLSAAMTVRELARRLLDLADLGQP